MFTNATKFFRTIYDIYGTYYDSLAGFKYWRDEIIETQKKSNLPITEMDKKTFIFGKGNPNKENSYPLHSSTQGEVKERNRNGGKNYKIIGNLCFVLIYNYWEYYRQKIAKEKGIDTNEINSSLMADIRYIRNSILKHDGKGNHEMKKCKILKWFKEDEKIFITKEKLEETVRLVREFTKELNEKYYT